MSTRPPCTGSADDYKVLPLACHCRTPSLLCVLERVLKKLDDLAAPFQLKNGINYSTVLFLIRLTNSPYSWAILNLALFPGLLPGEAAERWDAWCGQKRSAPPSHRTPPPWVMENLSSETVSVVGAWCQSPHGSIVFYIVTWILTHELPSTPSGLSWTTVQAKLAFWKEVQNRKRQGQEGMSTTPSTTPESTTEDGSLAANDQTSDVAQAISLPASSTETASPPSSPHISSSPHSPSDSLPSATVPSAADHDTPSAPTIVSSSSIPTDPTSSSTGTEVAYHCSPTITDVVYPLSIGGPLTQEAHLSSILRDTRLVPNDPSTQALWDELLGGSDIRYDDCEVALSRLLSKKRHSPRKHNDPMPSWPDRAAILFGFGEKTIPAVFWQSTKLFELAAEALGWHYYATTPTLPQSESTPTREALAVFDRTASLRSHLSNCGAWVGSVPIGLRAYSFPSTRAFDTKNRASKHTRFVVSNHAYFCPVTDFIIFPHSAPPGPGGMRRFRFGLEVVMKYKEIRARMLKDDDSDSDDEFWAT